jgi:hypothetical protein
LTLLRGKTAAKKSLSNLIFFRAEEWPLLFSANVAEQGDEAKMSSNCLHHDIEAR